jgi:hypothetical protein
MSVGDDAVKWESVVGMRMLVCDRSSCCECSLPIYTQKYPCMLSVLELNVQLSNAIFSLMDIS